MENPKCGVHGQTMSPREGKFGWFWSCGQKNADGSWCKFKPDPLVYPIGNEEKFSASLDQDTKNEQINKFQDRKEESIREMNAKNNACLLASKMPDLLMLSTPEMMVEIAALAKQIYNMEVGNEE